jgi:glycosyltransferase involved in cell wall biosynthesis
MEVLFVSHKHPPATGGMEKQSFELINGMKQYAKVHTIVYEGKQSKARFFLSLRKRIYQLCQQYPGISVIHYNDGLMAAWCSRFTRFPHIRRVVTLHGLDVVFPNTYYQRRLLPSFNGMHRIIAVSKATAQTATQRGVLPHKVVTIPNGVDTALAGQKSRSGHTLDFLEQQWDYRTGQRKLIVTMGRPVKRKGFSWFMKEVLPLLHPDALLVMVGPFRTKEATSSKLLRLLPAPLRRQIELSLGLPSDENTIRHLLKSSKQQAIHLGKLPFADVQRLLQAATAFVMPNIPVPGDMEGFGLVCLEACLCGAPVFAAHTDGIPDAIVHGQNGYLLPAGDAAVWAATLNAHFEGSMEGMPSPEDAVAYTKQHYSWDKMVQQYRQVFFS